MIFNDKKYVAKIIQNARKELNLKQSELAEKIGISEKHLSKIETGRNYPALDNFLKMAQILNLSLSDFGITNDNDISPKKRYLQEIINTSSEKQIEIYLDIIMSLKKHF